MKKGIKTLCATLSFGLVLLAVSCSGGKETNEATDPVALRAELKEQVANGALTMEEAQVKLAEATKKAKFKGKAKRSPALQALGAELKEKMANGALTAEEAKVKWAEAAKKSKNNSNTKGTKDSVKETE